MANDDLFILDPMSYIIGTVKGKKDAVGVVELDSDDYTFTDDGSGNITIAENA